MVDEDPGVGVGAGFGVLVLAKVVFVVGLVGVVKFYQDVFLSELKLTGVTDAYGVLPILNLFRLHHSGSEQQK